VSDSCELKRLAEHYIKLHGDSWHAEESRALDSLPTFSSEWFVAAASPKAVLGLIKDSERNQRMLLAACLDLGAIGEALGADMNSDGDEILGIVVDLKAQNSRLLSFLSDISKTSGDNGSVMVARELLKEFGQ
jgi:hypothetical protein